MKAITLYQPWASAIPALLKHYETRSWATKYRGPIAIHACSIKTQPKWVRKECAKLYEEVQDVLDPHRFDLLPHSCIVAVATLADCIPVGMATVLTFSDAEKKWGDYSPGRFAWKLTDIKPLTKPIPCSGGQRLWNVPAEVEERI